MEPTNNPQVSTNPETETPAAGATAPIDLNAGASETSAPMADLNAAAAEVSAAAQTVEAVAPIMPTVETPATPATPATEIPTASTVETAAAPVAPAAPVVEPVTAPTADVAAAPVAPAAPTVDATMSAADATMGANPLADAAATPGTNPVVGVPDTTGLISPTPPSGGGLDGLPMTAPIMRPDLPPAPDPVKQELEAPLKAAGPVVGSIGSAMSVSQDGTQLDANGQPIVTPGGQGGTTTNVAFNDPAKQPDAPVQPGAPNAKNKKAIKLDFKNMNRATLVTLIVVAVMVVIGLVAVLIVQLMG